MTCVPPGPDGAGRLHVVWRFRPCCLLPRQISGRRAACPPARRPRRELRSARRLEARPGPAGLAAASNRSGCLCVAWPGPAAHEHRRLAPPAPSAPAAHVALMGWLATLPDVMRYKVRPARLVAGGSDIKFALLGQNLPIRAILGEQGEFCTENAARAACWASFVSPWHWPRAGFPSRARSVDRPCRLRDDLLTGGRGGFALHEALLRCVTGVSEPLVVQVPRSEAVRLSSSPKCRPIG